MKIFKIIPVVLLLLSAPSAWSCPVCLEALERKNPRLTELLARIDEFREDTIPELRGLLADPESDPELRAAAARHLGIFRDRESIPGLRIIVLEIIDPNSPHSFGDGSPTAPMRDAAAASLGLMGVRDVADLIWDKWGSISLDRQVEIPRMLSQLQDPRAEERQIIILEEASRDTLAFQAVVELRRTGTAAAIPALEKKLEKWRRATVEEDAYGRRYFNRMIRYTEGTIRALRSR